MANNEILQVLVFSIFFGGALAGLGESGKTLTAVVDQLAQVMLRITGTIITWPHWPCSPRWPPSSPPTAWAC